MASKEQIEQPEQSRPPVVDAAKETQSLDNRPMYERSDHGAPTMSPATAAQMLNTPDVRLDGASRTRAMGTLQRAVGNAAVANHLKVTPPPATHPQTPMLDRIEQEVGYWIAHYQHQFGYQGTGPLDPHLVSALLLGCISGDQQEQPQDIDYRFWISAAIHWLFEKRHATSNWEEAMRAYLQSGARAQHYRHAVKRRSRATGM